MFGDMITSMNEHEWLSQGHQRPRIDLPNLVAKNIPDFLENKDLSFVVAVKQDTATF